MYCYLHKLPFSKTGNSRIEEAIRLGGSVIDRSKMQVPDILPASEEAAAAIPLGPYRQFKGNSPDTQRQEKRWCLIAHATEKAFCGRTCQSVE